MRTDTKKRENSEGMTLVEMIVTFAVAAIFMAAAALLIVPATNMMLHVKGMTRVHDDAAIIMETIVNELSYAEGYNNTDADETEARKILLRDPYASGDPDDPYVGYCQTIKYNSKNGNPAVMCVGTDSDGGGRKGKLLIIYPELKAPGDDGTEETLHEEMVWEYGQGLYQGNEIQLGFQKKPADPTSGTQKNIITVRLTITNPASNYSYTEEADICCINVTAEEIQEETAGP